MDGLGRNGHISGFNFIIRSYFGGKVAVLHYNHEIRYMY